MTEEKPPRDPTVPCPICGEKQLYTDYYDQCYACGHNVGIIMHEHIFPGAPTAE